MPGRRRLIVVAGALLAAPLTGCGRRRPKAEPLSSGATVLALGDSLTYGTGATPATSYPTVLGELTGWNVVNAGVPGDTSAQALARLPALMAEHTPALVVVGVGGNDFLRREPEDRTREHVKRIVEGARAGGAQVLLVAVPQPSAAAAFTGSLSDHPMYEELADALDVPLHAGGWAEVLSDASLRSDRIHANAQGYRRFAMGLANTLQTVGLR